MSYQIIFFKDENGKSPIQEYLNSLEKNSSTNKSSRIKLKKIFDYLDMLKFSGLSLKEPFIKHIDGDIWELRPLRDRILFISWCGNSFILLHHFMKQTQKTPAREIEQAKRNLKKFMEGFYGK